MTTQVFREESYIRELRRKEKDFAKDLESRGHKIQNIFRGSEISPKSNNKISKKNVDIEPIKEAEWVHEDGLTMYWNGQEFVVGDEAGLYEVDGETHYWDGEEWFLPKDLGAYDLNGVVMYWNGVRWE